MVPRKARYHNSPFSILNFQLPNDSKEQVRERRYEQKKALTECKTVLFLIELSFEKELISSEQCAEWTRHVMNVKNMTEKWRKQDRERFAALQQNRGITPRR